jgi:hypothetical protein
MRVVIDGVEYVPKDAKPRQIMISHAHGDCDVVAIYGGRPNQFLKSFDDDESAQRYIDSGEAKKDLMVRDRT